MDFPVAVSTPTAARSLRAQRAWQKPVMLAAMPDTKEIRGTVKNVYYCRADYETTVETKGTEMSSDKYIREDHLR